MFVETQSLVSAAISTGPHKYGPLTIPTPKQNNYYDGIRVHLIILLQSWLSMNYVIYFNHDINDIRQFSDTDPDTNAVFSVFFSR